MFDGKIKKASDLTVGDILIGPDKRKIISIDDLKLRKNSNRNAVNFLISDEINECVLFKFYEKEKTYLTKDFTVLTADYADITS